MAKFKAIVVGEIPANRLVCLVRPTDGDENTIYIRIVKAKELADFVSTGDLTDGQEVEVTIKNETTWTVEAAEDIPAGISLATTEDGKVRTGHYREGAGESTIGYSLHSAKAGELVEYVRIYKVSNLWINEVNNAIGVNAEPQTTTSPKHTGGGYYELSNGEKVQGKEAAEKAENELKERE